MISSDPSWLGPFYGDDFDHVKLESIVLERVDPKLIEKEAELMSVKWFDYRRIHCLQATYYFAEVYKQAYKEFMHVAFDADMASGIEGVFKRPKISKRDGVTKLKTKENTPDFMDTREFQAYWKLRQTADELRVPYTFFMTHANKWHLEKCYREKAIFPPRPGHITSKEELLVQIASAWEDEKDVRIQYAGDPYFTADEYDGSQNHQDYERFILSQIENREASKQYALATALYTRRAIRESAAEEHFGEDLLNRARDLKCSLVW